MRMNLPFSLPNIKIITDQFLLAFFHVYFTTRTQVHSFNKSVFVLGYRTLIVIYTNETEKNQAPPK
jgi:hypothetical protein